MIKKKPMRMCVICREKKQKKELIRIVNNEQEGVCFDASGKMNGRGAYICKDPECINNERAKKLLESALKTEIDDEQFCQIQNRINREKIYMA